MPLRELLSGSRADILFYETSSGRIPTVEFISGLFPPDQRKITRLLNDFAERGQIRNKQKFRYEDYGIFVFKAGQIRLACYFLDLSSKRILIVTHGFIKKKDKMARTELEKAKRIREELNKVV